jgi:hypothetical protein
MLKVNTAQISIPDFAKKYGMRLDNSFNDTYMIELVDNIANCYVTIAILKDDALWFLVRSQDIPDFPQFMVPDMIYDMISNGDIIKEIK